MDGDLDVLQTVMEQQSKPARVRLLDNAYNGGPTSHHYLIVRPRMLGLNTQALGAVCRVNAGGTSMQRQIGAGTSYLGQEPAEAHFGLGAATTAELVQVLWPDGTSTMLADVAADQVLNVIHGGPGDLNADGTVSAVDLVDLANCVGGPAVERTTACFAADLDRSGAVDLGDYALLQRLAN